MGFMQWLWGDRRRRVDVELLDALLTSENARRAVSAQTDQKRLEIEARRMELEFEHIEEQAENRRKDREAAQKLREQRRGWAAEARARIKVKHAGPAPSACRVCANPGDASLTTDDILWHHNGHPVRGASNG